MSGHGLKQYIDELVEKQYQELLREISAKPQLGEGISLLLEAKIDMFIADYQPDGKTPDPAMVKFLVSLKSEGILPKYIPWAIKIFKSKEVLFDPTYLGTYLQNYLTKYENYLNQKIIPQDKKDINQFKSFYDFQRFLGEIDRVANSLSKQKKEKEDISNKQTTKYYEDDTYVILEPKSEASSCQYGAGSKWCISATQSQNHFDEYYEKGVRFLFVVNKKTNDKDAIAFAGDVDTIEIYDAKDDMQRNSYISAKYPPEIIKKLNSILDPITGVSPFISFDLKELWNDPVKILDIDNPYELLTLPVSSLLSIFRKLSRLELADEVLQARRRETIESVLKSLITSLTSENSSYGIPIWDILRKDSNESFYDMPANLIRKTLYHLMFQTVRDNDPEHPPYKSILLALSYFPTQVNNIVTKHNWQDMYNRIMQEQHTQKDVVAVALAMQEIRQAAIQYIKDISLMQEFSRFNVERYDYGIEDKEGLASMVEFFNALQTTANIYQIHSFADAISYANDVVQVTYKD